MDQKTNIGKAFLSFSGLKVYGVLAIIFLSWPVVAGLVGVGTGEDIRFVIQISSAFVPIYAGYALRFFLVRNVGVYKKKLLAAFTPDQVFSVIFGGVLWGLPVVVLATACYMYTKSTIW